MTKKRGSATHTSLSGRQKRISAAIQSQAKVIKRQNLMNFDKLNIIKFYRENQHLCSQQDIIDRLRAYGYLTITQPTLSRYLKDEKLILDYVTRDSNRLYEKRQPLVTLPGVDAALSQWVIQKLHSNLRLNGDIIREKARDFCLFFKTPPDILKFSDGWLRSFKARLGLKEYLFHGEAASAPILTLEDERLRLVRIISMYAPWDVYNVDETGLFFKMVPNRALALAGGAGMKCEKKRLTYVLCANMDGSDKRTPLVIGNAERPRCFEKRYASELGFYYENNKKAWMVYGIWQRFIAHLNEDMRRQGRYILLLCDNAPSHKHDPAKYPHVRVEYLAPNLTAWIQPMDAGIIASFKAQYKRLFTRYALDRDDRGIPDIYKIEQLDAMRLADTVWGAVTPQTISNCWKHTGICPQPAPSLPLIPLDMSFDLPLGAPFDIPFDTSFDTSFAPSFDTPLDTSFDTSFDTFLSAPLDIPFDPSFDVSLNALFDTTFGANPLALPDFDQNSFGPACLPTELEQMLWLIDFNVPTEHEWTDQEIVDQILAKREGGYVDDDDDDED